MSTLLALISFAAETAGEHEEPDKTLFYIAGGALAAWAVILSAIGIKRHADWPASKGTARAIMALSAILVAFAMASAVITG